MSHTGTPAVPPLAQHIAREVRAEMARQGLSQEALGSRIGWDQKRVSRRLTGAVAIDTNELGELAAALGVPVTQFLPAEVAR